MNSVKRFKNLLSILLLYASNLIVHDKKTVIPVEYRTVDVNKRITGNSFLKLTTNEKL